MMKHCVPLLFLLLFGCYTHLPVTLELDSFPEIEGIGVRDFVFSGASDEGPSFEFRLLAKEPVLSSLQGSFPEESLGLSYRLSLVARDEFGFPVAHSESQTILTTNQILSFFLVLEREVSCNNDTDEDADGLINCEDDDCEISGICFCGNGRIDEGESCDDGNSQQDDGCNSFCRTPFCGNKIIELGEVCDDGNNLSDDGCIGCQPSRCGDGVVARDIETCDDQNQSSGDGCSSSCLLESEALSCLPLPATDFDLIVLDTSGDLFLWRQNSSQLFDINGDVVVDIGFSVNRPLALPTGGILFWGRDQSQNKLVLFDSLSGATTTVLADSNVNPATSAALSTNGSLFLGNSQRIQRLLTQVSPPVLVDFDEGFLDNEILLAALDDNLLIQNQSSLVALNTANPPFLATPLDPLPDGAVLVNLSLSEVSLFFSFDFIPNGNSYIMRFPNRAFLLEDSFQSTHYDRRNDQLLLLDAGCIRQFPLDEGAVFIDDDEDGVEDAEELLFPGMRTDNIDSDNDGLSDGFEFSAFRWLGLLLNPSNADTDGDGLGDALEL